MFRKNEIKAFIVIIILSSILMACSNEGNKDEESPNNPEQAESAENKSNEEEKSSITYTITDSKDGYSVHNVSLGMSKEDVTSTLEEDEHDVEMVVAEDSIRAGEVLYLFHKGYLSEIQLKDNQNNVYSSAWYSDLGSPFHGTQKGTHLYFQKENENVLTFQPEDDEVSVHITFADDTFYRDYFTEEMEQLNSIKEKSRITFEMKEYGEATYQVYLFADNEDSWVASMEDATVWLGANEGDTVYYGDYQIAIQKQGTPFVHITDHHYTFEMGYNEIYYRDQAFVVEAEGNADILVLSSVHATNDNLAQAFFIKDGKLEPIKVVWEDGTESPDFIFTEFEHDSDSTYIQRTYDNMLGEYHDSYFLFEPEKQQLTFQRESSDAKFDTEEDSQAIEQEQDGSIIGTWREKGGNAKFVFKSDGTADIEGVHDLPSGPYVISGSTISIYLPDSDNGVDFNMDLEGDTLTLTHDLVDFEMELYRE